MIKKSIILHEISQEIQTSVLMEKWFPNFFHTLLNYQLNKNYNKRNHELFPYCDITSENIRTLLLMIDYTSDYFDQDIKYIFNTITNYPIFLNSLLNNKTFEDIIFIKNNNNEDYYYFKLPNNFKINQLRIPVKYVRRIKEKYPKNSLEEIISLILRFSITSNYAWCSRSITNATTLMVPKILHEYIKTLQDNYLECYSCVLNTNTNNYCSIFIDDMIFDGCLGPFCLETLERIKPKLLFANPPYDNGTVLFMMSTLIEYHKYNKALSIITINRKDGGLYDMINERYDNEIYDGLLNMLTNRGSKLLDILVVPNYLMSYELVDHSDIKILGIKRDTSFIIYGDNILNTSIYDLKTNLLQLICNFRLSHTKKKKKIRYNNKFCKLNNIELLINKYNLSKKFNYKKSITDNYKLLSKIFN